MAWWRFSSNIGLPLVQLHRTSRSITLSSVLRLKEVLPPLESFAKRHIGPSEKDTMAMLQTCGVQVSYVLKNTGFHRCG